VARGVAACEGLGVVLAAVAEEVRLVLGDVRGRHLAVASAQAAGSVLCIILAREPRGSGRDAVGDRSVLAVFGLNLVAGTVDAAATSLALELVVAPCFLRPYG